MSEDILKQLRGRHECAMNAHGADLRLHGEAAKEIESLRAQLAEVTRERDSLLKARDAHLADLRRHIEENKRQTGYLIAAQANAARVVDLWAEVEQRYLALLKEKDEEAETFKAEGDMYGWNFHKGVRSGAVEMHLNMTKLIKAISTPINLDASHEDRARECERLANVAGDEPEHVQALFSEWLREEADAHRAKKDAALATNKEGGAA